MIDLWPDDIAETNIKIPATILREEVSVISEQTNNKVYPIVCRADPYIPNQQGLFMYNFDLKSPADPIYAFGHFTIAYDLNLYPVKFLIWSVEMHEELQFYLGKKWRGLLITESEKKFREALRAILKTKETQRVLTLMAAMSNGA